MKEKLPIIVSDLIIIAVGVVFLVLGIRDFKEYMAENTLSDAERFKKEYSYVDSDNSYQYLSNKEIKNFSMGTNILLIGDPLDSWTQILVEPLDRVIKNSQKKIYYIAKDNLSNDKIGEQLKITEFADSLGSPTIIFFEDGKVERIMTKSEIYEDLNSIPIEYWTDERFESFRTKIEDALNIEN